MNEETKRQNEIMVAMSSAGLLTWRNHVGVYRALNDPAKIIKIGTPGQADIFSILPLVVTESMVGQLVGLCYQIEVKTPKGKQSGVQKAWQQQTEKRGGLYTIATSSSQILDHISRITSGRL